MKDKFYVALAIELEVTGIWHTEYFFQFHKLELTLVYDLKHFTNNFLSLFIFFT